MLLVLAPSLGAGGLSAPLFAAAVIVPAAVFEVFAQVPAALVARRTVLSSARRVAELTETPLPSEIPGERVRESDDGELGWPDKDVYKRQQKTLELMTWVAGFTLPLVLAYQAWTYWIFRKRLSREQIPAEDHEADHAAVAA